MDSFVKAWKAGNYMMAIPLTAERMAELLTAYRASWRQAGHPGNGKVMLAFQPAPPPSTTSSAASSCANRSASARWFSPPITPNPTFRHSVGRWHRWPKSGGGQPGSG